MVLELCEGPVYEDYNKGITLFAGYDSEGMQNGILRSIKTDLDGKILHVAERLARENHFVLEQEIIEILRPYQKVAASFLDGSDTLYRARVGIKEEKEYYPGGFEMGVHFKPYTQEEIGAPPPYLASSGRVNRAGVSFLYCATEKDTALAEVRPHPGDRVSIAVMRVNSPKRLFDLSQSKLIHYFKTDEQLDGYRALNTLGVFLSRTIPPSERDQYSITQLIADCVRQLGFDGIMFSSTVGSGKNVVLFDGRCTTQVEAGAEVALIKSVKYEYAQEDLVVEGGDYYY
ncbi:RES family NAD+ phosphorylase [Pseudomonas sp. XS1P51]